MRNKQFDFLSILHILHNSYYLAFVSTSYVYCVVYVYVYFSNVFMKDPFSFENIIFQFVLLFLFNLLWFHPTLLPSSC